jgi:hypothetical protein
MGTRPFSDDDDPTPGAGAGKATPRAAPKSSSSKAPPPQAKPAPPEPKRIAWGHVGQVNFSDHLTDRTGRPGVVRIVGAGIHYQAPPLERYVWQPALDQPGRFEMPWPEGDPADVMSLGQLGDELRRNSPPPRARLQLLDQAVQTLLHLTQQLHDNDWRLGLLHPGNILLVPGSAGNELILSDLGFIWRGSHGKFPWKDSPGRPAWIEEDLNVNPNTRFWDENPVRQQICWTSDPELTPVSVASDLHTLARLFGTLLTGRVEHDLAIPANPAPCWHVLRAVMAGSINTAEELRTNLDANPLSGHWSYRTPATRKGGVPTYVKIGAVLCLFGLLVAAWKTGLIDRINGMLNKPVANNSGQRFPGRNIGKIEVNWRERPAVRPGNAEFNKLLDAFEATNDPRRWIELLIQMYQFYERADEGTRKEILPWIEYCRGRYGDDWIRRYRDSDSRVQKDISVRFDVGGQILGLQQELDGLRQKYEPLSPSLDEGENQCLEISARRSTELGSRR